MIRSSVDLPDPFSPSTPIFAPGKKFSEMFLMMVRWGGTVFETRRMVYTYFAMRRIFACRAGARIAVAQRDGINATAWVGSPARRDAGGTCSSSRYSPLRKTCEATW